MNLLYTLTTYPPSTGGAQIHQHQLAIHLKERHQMQVAVHWDNNRNDWLLGTTIKAPSKGRNYVIDGIDVHRIGFATWEKIFMAPFTAAYYPMMQIALPPIAARIEKHIKTMAAKAHLIHNVRIGREGLSYASYNAARKRGIPFVLTPVHHPRWVGWRYKAYNKLYTLADALFALTNAEKEILVGLGAKEERVHVIGHGPVLQKKANPQAFLKQHHIQGPMVLFLGQHYPYKGYRQVVEAAEKVWQKFPETHFVFIGPGVGQSETLFESLDDKRILRLGKVSLQEKTDALAACSLLCVPSTQESFGGVYAEAWCYEKPVIGCNIPAVSEVVTDGKDGFLVKQEPDEIADKIITLLDSNTLSTKMGANGKSKVKEKYTWQRIAQNVEKIYQTLIT